MREQSWLGWHLRDHWMNGGSPSRSRRLKWVVMCGVVALGMAAAVATQALGPQSAMAAPAQALAACAPSPNNKPTVSVDNFDTLLFTGNFAMGQTITIRGSNYLCNAPLTVVVSAAGGASIGTVAVTTDATTGGFETHYAIPIGTQPEEIAYPLTIQVYDAYATPLANLTLRGCQEGPGNTLRTPVSTTCGPQTLIQDGQNYHILSSLELDAEQQIADLRGVASDSSNVYFSRGEIRADMLANLLSKINNCGQDTNLCASYDDAYIINYYAGLVKQERVDVAQLADNLYEGSGQFCIPGTSSCNWQSWKTLQCGFLVPLGFGALTGATQSDTNQLAYQNETLTKIDCVAGGGLPEQPSFSDFTSWAAAAILTSQIKNWANRLTAIDPSYTTAAAAQTEVQQEYAAALDAYQEGATYLTLKDGQSLLPGGSTSQSTAVQTIGELLKGLTTEFGPDILEEMSTQIITKVIESLLPDLIGSLGSEALATADTVAPFIIAAVLAAAVGIYIGVTDSQLGCALQSALTAAQGDNLFNDVTGSTSYTYTGTNCPSGTVTIPQDGGVALLFGALMDSTMPDFTNLRNQAEVAGDPVPSDPVFVNAPSIANPPYTIQGDLNVQSWTGATTQVKISHGWFVVNGQYQPDLEYRDGTNLYRAWIDGNQFLYFRVALPLGPAYVQATIDGECPGVIVGPSIPTTVPGLCVTPQGQVSGTLPYQTASFFSHPAINPGDRIAVGQMTGEQGSFTGAEQANIRTVTAYSGVNPPVFLAEGITVDTPVLPDDRAQQPYGASYLLSQPAPNCFTATGITGPNECGSGPDLLYQAPLENCVGQCPTQGSFATLHFVGAAGDNFTVNQSGNLAGQVLANDAPTTGDQGTLLGTDVPDGNVQVSVVAGAANGTLNLTASTPPFAANGAFLYTTNGFVANSGGPSGGPSCVQNPVPGTTDPGYKECGGPTATTADSFIYRLCYTAPLVFVGQPSISGPTACTYARATIAGIPQTLTASPPAGPITVGDPPFLLPAPHSNTNGKPTYTIGSGSVGCSVDQNGTVTITGMAEGSNFCIIVETLPGFGGFLPAPPVTIEFHIAGQLLVTASHADVPYGDPAPAASTYSFSYSGFAPPDTQASIVGTNTPACSTNYQPGDGLGAYAITCTIGSLSAATYTFESGYPGSFTFTSTRGTHLSSTTVQLGTFKVVAAPLAVTAAHTDLTYSDPAPGSTSYTFSYSGFKGQDTQASIVGTHAPACSTTYQQGNNAGSYPINCTINTLSATNYTFVSGFLATNGTPLSSSAVQLGAFNVDPAPLSVAAAHTDLTFGDPIPAASSYTFSYSGFKLSDTQASVVGNNAPDCGTDYTVLPPAGGAGNYGIVCALGTLSATNYTFVSGYSTTAGTPIISDPPGPPVLLGRFKVNPAVLTVTPPTPPTVQYSDALPSLTPTVTGFVLNQNTSILTTQPTCTPGPVTASFSNGAGTVTTTSGVNAPAGSYTITCSGAVLYGIYATDYTIQYKTATLTVTQEDAVVDLTGAQSAVALPTTGSATNLLTATVWDSAATGYTGANPESGSTATIGDVTKMFVEFDIYPAGSCLTGTPAFAPVVSVSATTTAGVGTASYSFTQSTPGAYCVVPRVVGATAGSVNGFYTAPEGPVNGIAFYVPSGAFVTGGGWVPDAGSSNGHGNFGFEAHYNNGKPKGQFVYVWRGTYNGQAANFIIKSNTISALTIVQLGPNSYQATLQGKCSYTIVSQATGQQLYGEGNDTFSVIVTDGDNGLPQPQAPNDNFNLITFQSGNVQLHPIATIPLSKGDVVVHN